MAYYVDEDTDEQVAIERSSLVDIPIFKRDTKFEQRVYSTFCDVYMTLPYIIYKRTLYMLAYAEFETSRLAYSRLMAEEKRITGGGCITPYDEDICVDLGDIYCMGWEEFGITIDQTKAKAFYDRAGVDGYSLLDEE